MAIFSSITEALICLGVSGLRFNVLCQLTLLLLSAYPPAGAGKTKRSYTPFFGPRAFLLGAWGGMDGCGIWDGVWALTYLYLFCVLLRTMLWHFFDLLFYILLLRTGLSLGWLYSLVPFVNGKACFLFLGESYKHPSSNTLDNFILRAFLSCHFSLSFFGLLKGGDGMNWGYPVEDVWSVRSKSGERYL